MDTAERERPQKQNSMKIHVTNCTIGIKLYSTVPGADTAAGRVLELRVLVVVRAHATLVVQPVGDALQDCGVRATEANSTSANKGKYSISTHTSSGTMGWDELVTFLNIILRQSSHRTR